MTNAKNGGEMVLCAHGYQLKDCAKCLKRPGECDYGNCQQKAAVVVGQGDVFIEKRVMCAKHGAVAVNQLGYTVYKEVS